MKCKMAGRMIRWALFFALLLMPAVCHAQAQHPLVGTWRFAGGAEVLGYGLQILEDGTCILMNTDDFDHFPPEKLFPRDIACTWKEKNGVVSFSFPGRVEKCAWQLYEENQIVHFAEGDGGGHYERCDETLVMDADPLDDEIWLLLEHDLGDLQLMGCRKLENAEGQKFTLVLVWNGQEYSLHVFRWNKREKEWQPWRSTSKGIPQGKNMEGAQPPLLAVYPSGERIPLTLADAPEYTLKTDNSWFTIWMEDEETVWEKVIYRWQGDSFHLVSYWYGPGCYADIRGDRLIFSNIGDGKTEIVKRMLNTNLRSLDFYALPHQNSPDRQPPELQLYPASFPEGERWPVYAGPGTQYPRSGNGKAVVSTNGSIDVLGEYDGFLLICYEISTDKQRFGWIDAGALKKGETVPPVLFNESREKTLLQACDMTDDPFFSGNVLVSLDQGEKVTWLASLDAEWAYVRVEKEGEIWYGFLPLDVLDRGNG